MRREHLKEAVDSLSPTRRCDIQPDRCCCCCCCAVPFDTDVSIDPTLYRADGHRYC